MPSLGPWCCRHPCCCCFCQLQAVPRDVVCQSVKGALVTSVAECVSPINVTTVTIFTSGSLVVVPPLTTNFDESLVRTIRNRLRVPRLWLV